MVDPGPLPEAPASAAERAIEEAEDAEIVTSAEEVAVTDSALADELPALMPAMLTKASATNALADAQAPPISGAVARDPVAALFDVVRVERTSSGGVRIEAPAESARSLLALFEGMSKLLAGATAP
jgi:hypothetical protein